MRAEDIALATTRILTVAAQVDSAVQQMTFSGSTIANLDFVLPGQAAFNTGSDIHKAFIEAAQSQQKWHKSELEILDSLISLSHGFKVTNSL